MSEHATHTQHHEAVNQAVAYASVDPAEHLNRLAGLPHPVVQNHEVLFSFKKPRKGPDGKEPTDEVGQPIVARPSFKMNIPVPTFEGLIKALENEKTQEYILDIIADAVKGAARAQVDDETKPVNRQEDLRLDQLTLEYLANVPKTERRGAGIPKEVWAEWEKDYISVMLSATGKEADKIGNAAKLFLSRLQPIKTNKKVLQFLAGQLDIWMENTQNSEEFADVYEFLRKKTDEFLNADEASLLANL